MRPALKAGLLPLWRDRDTLQLGVDPRRAVALGGLGAAAAVIGLLDGSRDRESLIAAAGTRGVPAAETDRVLALLAAAGVLDDFPARLHASLPGQLRARLAPELAAASLAYADGDGGARTLARRRAAFVRVHGAGRTGACVASFLAASGVGHVSCADPEPAEPADLAPAGLILADLGSPRQEGAARAVERAAPEVRTRDDGAVPDLVILTEPTLPDLTATLRGGRVPHLALRTGEAIGVVGPLVRPGSSACLRCVDLHKTEADPQWPKILAQATFARAQPQACDTVLAAMTATLASAQALALIDRPDAVPVTVNGTLEVALPDWQWRRRTWLPHRACDCGGFSPGIHREAASMVRQAPV
ncbi:MAG: ThiF family adenylyltransferase [Actinobacteria bacterium]|nr:ThiF family adenylyltransferase [Actinomycetota bacterium]